MKFLPQTLLGRTALLIALILILSQTASTLLFRFYYNGPRAQQTADLIIANLNSIGAALEILPAAAQPVFLKRLTVEQDVRVLPGSTPSVKQQSNSAFFGAVCERLEQHYGEAAYVSLKDQGDPVFWVKLSATPQSYWIGLPLNRVSRGFPWPRVQWLFIGGLLSLLGAYLVVRRINRPLYQLAQAAQDIGQGKTPLLAETGPEEIRRVCRAFNQMARDVQQLDSDRNLLLAGVSHDLRTPLARLRLAIELLENTGDPALRHDMIQDIETMDEIISQFLAYVRQGVDEAAAPSDLNRLLQELSERFNAPGQDITLHLAPLPLLPFKPLAMQRLFSNLLSNAVLHGNSDIEVHTQALPDRIVVKVLDRGPGIPEAERQRMLQPFMQMASARRDKGAGLGLAIVDRIARLHNGSINLLPREGGGLEAHLELPINT